MVASYIKKLKSSTNFTKFFRETYDRLLLFHDHFKRLDNQNVAGDVVPSTRKCKIHGSEFDSLSRFSENLRKSSCKIKNSGNL